MERKQQFPSLTGLKGLFIWIIVWFHTAPETNLFSAIPGTSFLNMYGGSLGNTMFFILSGFLISWSCQERISNGSLSFGQFLKRRLTKLYPTYMLSDIVMIILSILLYGISAINIQKIVFDFLLQSGGGFVSAHPYNGPGWFVSALLVCYIAYYLITYHAKNTTAYRCSIAAGIAWGYMLLISNWTLPFCHGQNGTAFMNFFIGCAIAEVFPYMPRKMHRYLQIAAFVILPSVIWLLFRYGVEVISGNSHVAFAFVICPLIVYLALENRLCIQILSSKPVLWLGKISMSVYFWHYVVYVGYRWLLELAGREIGSIEYLLYLVIVLVWSSLPITQGVNNLIHKLFFDDPIPQKSGERL